MVQAMRTDTKETAQLSEMSQRDLADMVAKAQDERFKLLRAMKGFAAVQSDDAMITPATEGDGPISPETLSAELPDKLAKIDTWLNRRMADMQRAEARIDRRMAQLDRVEQSVRELTTKLDAQLNSISPDGAHTKRVQQMVWRSLSEVLDNARQQIATISRPLDDRLAVMRQAEQDLTHRVEQVQKFADEARMQLTQQVTDTVTQAQHRAEELMHPLTQALPQIVDSAVKEAQRRFQEKFDEHVASLHDAIHEKVLHARDVTEHHIVELNNKLESHQRDTQSVLADMQQQFEQRLNQAQQQAQVAGHDLVYQFDESIEQRIADIKSRFERARTQLNKQLDGIATQVDTRSNELAGHIDECVDVHLPNAQADAQAKLEQMTATFNQAKSQGEQQLNASRDRAEAMLLEFAARFDEQSQSHAYQADAQIETFSAQARQVLDKNRDLIDQAQTQVNDRVLAMQERLSERVARTQQVAAVADLKEMVDRAEEAARSLEALIELHEPTADSDLIEAELDDCAHAAGTSVLEVRPLMDQLKQTADRLRGVNDPELPASDTV